MARRPQESKSNGHSTRFTTRDYAIMRRVATDSVAHAIDELESRLPDLISKSVHTTFELIGVDTSSPASRDRVRAQMAALSRRQELRLLISSRGLGTLIAIVVTSIITAAGAGLLQILGR